jgi:hypothetical protein
MLRLCLVFGASLVVAKAGGLGSYGGSVSNVGYTTHHAPSYNQHFGGGLGGHAYSNSYASVASHHGGGYGGQASHHGGGYGGQVYAPQPHYYEEHYVSSQDCGTVGLIVVSFAGSAQVRV